jgi:hypothetical protein
LAKNIRNFLFLKEEEEEEEEERKKKRSGESLARGRIVGIVDIVCESFVPANPHRLYTYT